MTEVQPLRYTRETVLDETVAASFHGLYLAAFGPLRTRAVARQVLHDEEFFAEMRDPRVEKHVAWAGTLPVVLTTLTRHLETVPWVSPEYFTARYPDQAARGAIYYLGFTLVHDSHRGGRLWLDLLRSLVPRMVAERAVCAYDVCAYNNETVGFASNVEAMLHSAAEVMVERLDVQSYYCADFTSPSEGPRLLPAPRRH